MEGVWFNPRLSALVTTGHWAAGPWHDSPHWPAGLVIGQFSSELVCFYPSTFTWPSLSSSPFPWFYLWAPAEWSLNSLSQNKFHGTGATQAKTQLSPSSPSPWWHVPRQSPRPLNSPCRWFLLGPCFPSLISTVFMPRLLKQPCNWDPYSTISLFHLIPHTVATLIILKHHFHYQSSSYSILST